MQKIIYNCDMCGKEVDEDEINSYGVDSCFSYEKRRIDLCDECAEKWFKSVNNKALIKEK